MEYVKGEIKRVFVLRFDHGDDFLEELTTVVKKENIRSAWFHVLGGIRRTEIVTGPKEPVMPPDPVWQEIDDTREVIGLGSVFWEEEQPKIHLHAALGHHGDTISGCMRRKAEVYLILEVYLIEIGSIDAHRPWYPRGGFNRLEFR